MNSDIRRAIQEHDYLIAQQKDIKDPKKKNDELFESLVNTLRASGHSEPSIRE